MRDIKFRAWDGEVMYSQDDIGDDYNFVIGGENSLTLIINQQFHEYGSGVAEEYWGYIAVNAEFMQFTGLKDCNGVEIYEGDIVESDFYAPEIKEIAEIGYCEHLMKFIFISGEQDAFEYGSLTVIGNIHENKDLL